MTADATQPEFPRPVKVDGIADGGAEFDIAATAGERKALAKRFGLAALQSLTAKVRLDPRDEGKIFALTGRFAADLEQSCVVTLAPVNNHIEGAIDRRFSAVAEAADDLITEFEVTDEEPPDPIADGVIDIGEAVAEHMGLEVDPYPRLPDREVGEPGAGGVAEEANERHSGPFSVLEKLKRGDK